MKHQFIVPFLFLFTACFANAVSRVGGGKIQSTKSGFEMEINSPFNIAGIAQEAVRCLGPVSMIQKGTNFSMGTQFFEISEFANEFTDAAQLSAEEVIARFEKSGWQPMPSQSCNITMRLRTEGAIAYLVTWGAGKGFVMKGTPTGQTEQSMRDGLKSMKIHSGCSWK